MGTSNHQCPYPAIHSHPYYYCPSILLLSIHPTTVHPSYYCPSILLLSIHPTTVHPSYTLHSSSVPLPRTAYRPPTPFTAHPMTAYHRPPTTDRLPATYPIYRPPHYRLPQTPYHGPPTGHLPHLPPTT